MNTVALPPSRDKSDAPSRSSPGAFALDCWRRLDWRYWSAALLAGAVLAVINALSMIEYAAKLGTSRLIVWAVVMPLLTAVLVLLAWSIADAVGDHAMRRPWRIALAVAIGAGIGVSVSMIYYELAGLGAVMHAEWIAKGRAAPSLAAATFGEWFNAVVNGALFVVAGEVYRSRVLVGRRAQAALREQASMAREVLEARLAAMQAQVEPRFLFDSLVDIRKLYEEDAARGAGTLDQLITFLRVALPRLRESGSTLGWEVDLVAAYVAVVAARHHGVPRITIRVAQECLAARFSPMLLLPLVQRAVRSTESSAERNGDGALPQTIELSARLDAGQLVAELRFAAAGLCRDDDDLARVRQRLGGLYAAGASLECTEPEPGATLFTLRLPHERSADSRRGEIHGEHDIERSESWGGRFPPVVHADGGGR